MRNGLLTSVNNRLFNFAKKDVLKHINMQHIKKHFRVIVTASYIILNIYVDAKLNISVFSSTLHTYMYNFIYA